jgi:hypothetical protein
MDAIRAGEWIRAMHQALILVGHVARAARDVAGAVLQVRFLDGDRRHPSRGCHSTQAPLRSACVGSPWSGKN